MNERNNHESQFATGNGTSSRIMVRNKSQYQYQTGNCPVKWEHISCGCLASKNPLKILKFRDISARSRPILGLQAGLWTEMRVSVNIKQELPGRVGTHQLERLGIKESFESTEIQRFHRSFTAVNGTSGWIMAKNESQCLYQTDKAETSSF
jgi:hypothetical protein